MLFGDDDGEPVECGNKESRSPSTILNENLDQKYKRIKITDGYEDFPVVTPGGEFSDISSTDEDCEEDSETNSDDNDSCDDEETGECEETADEEEETSEDGREIDMCTQHVKFYEEDGSDESNESKKTNDSNDDEDEDGNFEEIQIDPCEVPEDKDDKDDKTNTNEIKVKCAKRRRSKSPDNCGRSKRKRKQPPCMSVDKRLNDIMMTVREKCLKKKLQKIEENAEKLWTECSKDMRQCATYNVTNSKWQNMKSHQKLPFYWATIAGDFVSEKPFDNFVHFYLVENSLEAACTNSDEFIEILRDLWISLHKVEKMPFVMEAFIYQVSMGQVNLKDDTNIKSMLDELYNDEC